MGLNSGIYRIENLCNRKIYIGSSVDVHERWCAHKRLLIRGKHRNNYLQHAWNLYGEESFVFDVLEYTEPSRLLTREQFWIDCTDSVNRGYNICPVAGSNVGCKYSTESRERMSLAQRGHAVTKETRDRMSAALKGRKLSPEHCSAMSRAKRGRKLGPMSAEHRANLSAVAKGRTITKETRAKLSVAGKGRKRTPETRAKLSEIKLKQYADPTAIAKLREVQNSPELKARISATKQARRLERQVLAAMKDEK